ncbi:mannose-1-phosphate guanylyltransferase [Paenibacillus farraposensis]|uniref:Mannose-1-phosphate guanylyltransferase n=1 Tax=Paenibacillus farraposensis TaxID=2807095 RepID=A0ABW4DGB8_9BACL|nr:sugar phosphate nucleotidyltransferase [Paenibacillus farraposensis]MCC3380784.1 mannose-1-phosphate guanylyltransferase [Paenibacillus farraposensis]
MNYYAVIMAGGAGLRLWPLSRENKPKQFLCIDGNRTMLEQTFERIIELVPPERFFVITNSKYSEMTKNVFKNLIPPENILLEPIRKNTAACISYAALWLKHRFGNGNVCFVPADSFVLNKEEYLRSIRQAYTEAEKEAGLVIIGVNPTYPSTGYGYIKITPADSADAIHSFNVLEFKEKPDLATAQTYVESGHYLWNSGMVAGTLDSFTEEINQHLPEHFSMLSSALEEYDTPNYPNKLKQAYSGLPDLSFDNGVLEKSGKQLRSIKGRFDWNDIGSLDALEKVLGLDEANNAVHASFHGIDTRDSIIFSNDHTLITTIGLSNLIIIKTGDVILVCPKDKAQEIKAVVQQLKGTIYGDRT